jgi:hypothetical protein
MLSVAKLYSINDWMLDNMENRRNENCRGELEQLQKTCPTIVLPNINPTKPDPGKNPGMATIPCSQITFGNISPISFSRAVGITIPNSYITMNSILTSVMQIEVTFGTYLCNIFNILLASMYWCDH